MRRSLKFRLLSTVSILALCLPSLPVSANPLGGQVVGGSATITGETTNQVTVNQSTEKGIIDWRSFNLAPGDTTNFIQPDSSAITLNRVTGGLGASSINGMIGANGSVFVVNPDGILFGKNAVINTNSFLGTTNDIANGDFMAGKLNFSIPGNPSASIVNEGTITAANGGFAALVAPGVRNDGIITANLGSVDLSSGNTFTLDLYGDNLINLQPSDSVASEVRDVATGETLQSLVSNTGTLRANGGRVALTAVAARRVLDSVINTSGTVEANTVGTHKGLVVFGAATGSSKPAGAPRQVVRVAGRVSAAGRRRGTSGGRIEITGENIQLASATLDASGQTGGGTIAVGGAGAGGAPLPEAQSVTLDATSAVHADATGAGNGGEITFWSAGSTRVEGLITAMGGRDGGNGGSIETSGEALDFAGLAVNTSAPLGVAGTWLLDPTDLTIGSGDIATLDGALNGGTSVTLTTTSGVPTETGVTGLGTTSSGSGDINIDAGISWSGSAALTLQALNNININAAISLTNGTLNLRAAGNTSSSTASTTTSLSTGAIVINAPITISGAGTVNLKANSLSSLTVDTVTTTFNPTDFELSFGTGGSINYGTTDSGGHLNINSAAYSLLYSTAGIANIDTTGDSGHYALATSVTDSTTHTAALAGAGADNNTSGHVFSGVFEGLGNTISDLQISSSAGNQYLGLFGQSSGVLRDLILSGGSVSSGTVVDTDSVGALVGMNIGGLVANVTSSTSVSGSGTPAYFDPNGHGLPSDYISAGGGVGGLVGANVAGNVMQSQATGTVTDSHGFFENAVGGLVGINTGNIDINDTGYVGGNGTATVLYSSATGQVNGGSDSFIGGLVGSNIGSGASSFYGSGGTLEPTVPGTANIIGSWASGNVSGSFAGITGTVTFDNTSAGGLVGGNQDSEIGTGTGLILDSYARGNVSDTGNSGASPGNNNGGLVGYEGTNNTQAGGMVIIKNSYATGSVTGLSGDIIGGAIGGDCESNVGCDSVFGLGTITNVYASNGVPDSDPSDGATAVTTGQLQGGTLPGLASTVWTAGTPGNDNSGFPVITVNAPIPPTTPITYIVTDAMGTYGTLTNLGMVTFSGDPADVMGTISLYNSSNVLVTYSAGLAAGTYTEEVTALTGTGAAAYSIASMGNTFGTLTIAQVPLTITADNQTKVYGAALPTLTATYTGLVNGDTVADLTTAPTLSANATAASHVSGNPYAITARGAVDPNYIISYVAGSLTVTTAPLTVTANNQNKAYGAPVPTLTASYAGFVNGDSAASLTVAPTLSTTATSDSHVAANPYAITPSGAADTDYAISYVAGALTVTPAPLTITANNATKVYGATPVLTASYTGFVSGDTRANLTTQPTLSTTDDASVTGSPYAITASGAVDPDYTISYVGGALTVTPAPLTITANNQTKVYGAAVPTLTASYTGFVNGDTSASLSVAPTLTTTADGSSSVGGGPYVIAASGAVDPNYTISYVGGSLSVTTAPLRVTADDATSVYGTFPSLGVSYSGFVNGDTQASLTNQATLSVPATPSSDVGTYTITPSGVVDTNYTISYATGTLTITPASLTITANNATKVYGATPVLTASYVGFVNGDTRFSLTTQPMLSTTEDASVTGSPYAITASGAVDPNYTISYMGGALTVTPAPLTITANNQTKVYGAAVPTLTASYTGFVNGDSAGSLTTTPTLTTTATAASSVADNPFAITASGAVDPNYTISYVAGSLIVTPATLTITADNQTKIYGAALPTLTASYTGFVNGDSARSLTTAPTLTTTATAASSVADNPFAITASGAVDPNYTISYVGGSLTITPATLTITADNQTSTYGAALPALTLSYSGLVNGDTSANLSSPATAGTIATAASNAGNYAIVASGAHDNDYAISYIDGTLAIGAAHITVTANGGTSVYGSPSSNPGFTATGLQNGQNVSVLTGLSSSFGITATSDVDLDPYILSVVGTLSNPNYTIDQRNTGTWTVTPATLTYVANPVSRVGGIANPTLTGSVIGFVLSDTLANATSGVLTFTSSASPASLPGSYAIVGGGLVADNDNYLFVQAAANATALMVAPNNIWKTSEAFITHYPTPDCNGPPVSAVGPDQEAASLCGSPISVAVIGGWMAPIAQQGF